MALEKIILKKGSSTAETYTKGAIDTLLSGKQPSGNYQPAGSYATLGSDGKVPSSQLPSYVDDVLEYTAKSAFPATGEAGKIYIAKDTNKTYRWSGSAYVEISASLALGETSSTAYAGNKGKANADAIAALQTGKANKATTLSGYGITDAYTKTDVDTKVNAKATKATTLSGYGITDAYTKSQVDSAVADAVPKSKVMATYTANYAISDGQIEIYLKNNNGTVAKEFKITPNSLVWNNQTIATVDQIPDVSNKADKATTLGGYGITDAYTQAVINNLLSHKVNWQTEFTNYRAEFTAQDGEIGMALTKLDNTQEYYVVLSATQGLIVNDKVVATVDQIPDISTKANHTTVATSSDGKTITFTFD